MLAALLVCLLFGNVLGVKIAVKMKLKGLGKGYGEFGTWSCKGVSLHEENKNGRLC